MGTTGARDDGEPAQGSAALQLDYDAEHLPVARQLEDTIAALPVGRHARGGMTRERLRQTRRHIGESH
jgi:hypothetical protein